MVALAALPAGCSEHDAGPHDGAHHDAQAPGAAAIEQLALDAGRKWRTNEPLRAGMGAVHAAFAAEHAAIDAGSASDAQYDALAGRIDCLSLATGSSMAKVVPRPTSLRAVILPTI